MNQFNFNLKLIVGLILGIGLIMFVLNIHQVKADTPPNVWWEVQSVDTMKFSRDKARETLRDLSFDETIDFQMKNIADMGATHVAIGTPYDEEFIPILRRWVSYAREYNLNIWFRGNFAGWEEWFDYEKISKEEHLALLQEFLKENPDLFEDGDIFTSCPECENGALGDPRETGQVSEFRNFLVEEYESADRIFKSMRKDVKANYFSMNGDVALLVMDKQTTQRLDGIMVVDHYVETPEQLIEDIRQYKDSSGGRVVLGEIGVSIPDIHGNLTEAQRVAWLHKTLTLLAQEESVVGLNYWVFSGGSTSLWTDKGEKRDIADVLALFYKPKKFTVKVSNELGQGVGRSFVYVGPRTFSTNNQGIAEVSVPPGIDQVTIKADGYKESTQSVIHPENSESIVLKQERETLLFKILTFLRNLLRR